jgi:hypothetical protein
VKVASSIFEFAVGTEASRTDLCGLCGTPNAPGRGSELPNLCNIYRNTIETRPGESIITRAYCRKDESDSVSGFTRHHIF